LARAGDLLDLRVLLAFLATRRDVVPLRGIALTSVATSIPLVATSIPLVATSIPLTRRPAVAHVRERPSFEGRSGVPPPGLAYAGLPAQARLAGRPPALARPSAARDAGQ
jgi:hypothetical protein